MRMSRSGTRTTRPWVELWILTPQSVVIWQFFVVMVTVTSVAVFTAGLVMESVLQNPPFHVPSSSRVSLPSHSFSELGSGTVDASGSVPG